MVQSNSRKWNPDKMMNKHAVKMFTIAEYYTNYFDLSSFFCEIRNCAGVDVGWIEKVKNWSASEKLGQALPFLL